MRTRELTATEFRNLAIKRIAAEIRKREAKAPLHQDGRAMLTVYGMECAKALVSNTPTTAIEPDPAPPESNPQQEQAHGKS